MYHSVLIKGFNPGTVSIFLNNVDVTVLLADPSILHIELDKELWNGAGIIWGEKQKTTFLKTPCNKNGFITFSPCLLALK